VGSNPAIPTINLLTHRITLVPEYRRDALNALRQAGETMGQAARDTVRRLEALVLDFVREVRKLRGGSDADGES
jgi:hypothetical protein